MNSAKSALASDSYQYTNRCFCGRFLTKLEILDSIAKGNHVCPCGNSRFRPSNAKWWEELFLIRSWKLWWAIRNGTIPPPPTKEEAAEARALFMGKVAAMEGYDDDECVDNVDDLESA